MDVSKSCLTVALYFGFLSLCCAGCQEEILQSKEFANCMHDLSTLLTIQDSDVINVICSPKGKLAIQCLHNIKTGCPDLNVPGIEVVDLLNGVGGLDSLCKRKTAAQFNPSCLAMEECVMGLKDIYVLEDEHNIQDPFQIGKIQSTVKMVCGPIIDSLKCMIKAGETCPKILELAEQEIKKHLNKADFTFRNFTESTNSFCSSLPSDFHTNRCVKERTGNTAEIYKCLPKLNRESLSCSDVKDMIACVPLEECGTRYSKALTNFVSLHMSTFLPEKCDFTGSPSSPSSPVPQRSNSNTVRMSGYILLTTFFLFSIM